MAASDEKQEFKFSSNPSLEELRRMHSKFSSDRQWDEFHTPRNLLLALVGEVGEVAELFQWKGECKEGLPDWTAQDKVHLGEELSDVLIYLIRLSEKCNIDLPSVVVRKMGLNALKYPVEKALGSSKKYTEYINGNGDCNGHSSPKKSSANCSL